MALILPNTIANLIPADGDKLNQNFDTIVDWANQDAITADGSTGMTAPLLLPGAPTQPNQAATKAYVDTAVEWKPRWGETVLNFNQGGGAYLIHGLGKVPTSVQLTVHNGGASPVITVYVTELVDANQISVVGRDAAGQPAAFAAVAVYWVVFP